MRRLAEGLGRLRRAGRDPAAALATLADPAVQFLFEADGAARVLLDAEGRVLRHSPGVVPLLGAGTWPDLAALVPPEGQAPLRAAMAQPAATVLALHGRHADGSLVPLRARVLPLRTADGAASGAVLVLEDARPTLQQEAGQLHARKLQAVGELAGGVAQDFNNMLQALIGAADGLAERPELSPDAREEVALVQGAARRGATLVAQLLAFSRQQTLQPRIVAVNAAVRDLAPLLRRSLGGGVRLSLMLDEPERQARIDPGQLDQVLVNLAVNARDAMPQGGTLTLRTGRLTVLAPRSVGPAAGQLEAVPPGRYVAIEVQDSGTGIPPDVLPRIFEPFFTTRGARGSGLGLATVLGIVRQSGGFLELETQAGQGTTFRILLPRVREEATAETGPAPPPAARAVERPAAGSRGRILLAEDEEPVLRLAAGRLTRQGWEVLAAESGEAALDLLGEGRVDAIVTDMMMPGMDGTALVAEVRRRLARPDLPALITSGYANVALHDSIAAAATAFLPKPYALRDLSDRVAALVPAPEGVAPT